MSFDALGLLPSLAENLVKTGISEPTLVQRLAIPALLGGGNVAAVARTGSGKTLAYGLPLVQRVHEKELSEGPPTVAARPRALVVTATRELVAQTVKVLKSIGHRPPVRVRAAFGGLLPGEQRKQLSEPFEVLVGNPSRIATLVKEKKLDLSGVFVLVVDEADTLLAPGQRPDVETLLGAVSPDAQLVFVSATLPEPIRHYFTTLPRPPAVLLSKDAHTTPTSVTIRNLKVKEDERLDATADLLSELKGRGILFANRRETATEVGAALSARGLSVEVISGALRPDDRKAALKRFLSGEREILVTTELGGRGIDIADLKFVVNYELPEKPSEYLHRVGRVGRQGRKGVVVNLVTQQDTVMLAEITRLAKGGKLDTGEPLRIARHRPPAPEREEKKRVTKVGAARARSAGGQEGGGKGAAGPGGKGRSHAGRGAEDRAGRGPGDRAGRGPGDRAGRGPGDRAGTGGAEARRGGAGRAGGGEGASDARKGASGPGRRTAGKDGSGEGKPGKGTKGR